MSEQEKAAPRRRSSIAYDPARDTFTSIPDTVVEEGEAQKNTSTAETERALQSSSPPQPTVNQGLGKRRRSNSLDAEEDGGAGLNGQEPKRRRDTPPGEPRSPQLSKDQPDTTSNEVKAPKSVSELPRIKRKPREDGEEYPKAQRPPAYNRRPDDRRDDRRRANGHTSRRSRSPDRRRAPDAFRRRSPPRQRTPSPIRASPPRDPIVRPGGARGRGRNVLAEQERLAAAREAETQKVAPPTTHRVQDVSNQFYNARPEWVKERGREWRRNESQIKGLRSYNNWIKSCLIQRFSAEEKTVGEEEDLGWGEEAKEPQETKPLLVLDLGCGKGGDLGKWQLAPQSVGLYVGLDPAETSVKQAEDRYFQMRRNARHKPIFDGRFVVKDCFGEWIGEVPIVREVGIDANVGSAQSNRWGGGGFDVVTTMFSMHYAFESEDKVRMMLRNVAGSLKKGGRFVGVVPNSDMLAERVREWFSKKQPKATLAQSGSAPVPEPATNVSAEEITISTTEHSSTTQERTPPTTDPSTDETPTWGNSIYRVTFPQPSSSPDHALVPDGSFRPPFGWKYTYWMAEAVDVPEFVVPWEAFRALAEGFNLEQRYRKPFLEVWDAEKGDREMRELAQRMGVIKGGGGREAGVEGMELSMNDEEKEAVGFYHAFCFVKV